MESRNKKNCKIHLQTLCFFVFYCNFALKYHAAAKYLIGGRKSFENGMAVVFGECSRECLSEPGNTGNCVRHIRGAIIFKQTRTSLRGHLDLLDS